MTVVDMSDIDEMTQAARRFAVEDGGVAIGIRMFDGIADLLTEVIRELREIKERLPELDDTDS